MAVIFIVLSMACLGALWQYRNNPSELAKLAKSKDAKSAKQTTLAGAIIFGVLALVFMPGENALPGESVNTSLDDPKVNNVDPIGKMDNVTILRNLYVGEPVPYNQFDTLGQPETLPQTTNSTWFAYYPKLDVTMVSDKETDIVRELHIGRL